MGSINLEQLPLRGLREIDASDMASVGNFLSHPRSGFFLCRSGELVLADARNYYYLHEGDIYIYPSFSGLYIKSFSEDLKGIVGIADIDFVISVASQVSDIKSELLALRFPCISLSNIQRIRIESIISILHRRERDDVEPLQKQVCEALGQAICYEIAQAYSATLPNDPIPAGRFDQIFLGFLFSLKEHYTQHRDVAWYAAQQHLSPRYFSHVIHQRSGQTALQWIGNVVIAEAKRLLSDSSLSVKEAATMLGFPTQSFFGRYFKQATGLSPTEYKKSLR